ncbi:tRNA (uridine(54)-C5)-methyltransferase TrmA [Gilvimarinus algae]|uniref:tRNA/tmRNA (uracil-C(5))-methyltransferase n=1 Tax=Gilvimarinus algae TaxID=3058037 RepID=A0ABT8TEK4_9GAMM|nr:tRNA (uridine(54)-C5)-methyltransferase TrmA [Gilvimarinus sp. SDUM040014]MDO3382519.1 tRNA (uridine(54)-C5)-methyltransferase TrmA [Gilvimarinus sp. SDUM040014]
MTQAFSDEAYPRQLQEKLAKIQTLFSNCALPEIELFDSPARGFRMRAEFKIWHEGSRAHYAMYRQGEYKKPYFIDDFPQGFKTITQLMPPLLEAINASELLRRKLFQAEFLTTLSGEALVTLIYHKKLDEQWDEAARPLQQQFNMRLIGRSRGQKRVLDRDYVTETLTVSGRQYRYQQIESSFTQPNAIVCEKMLGWAVKHSAGAGGDLLELYCGNGNFTLPLAQNFERVLATELAKSSVKSAQYNMALNGIGNIETVRMSSEDFSQALDKVRPFRRLQHLELDSYRFTTLFVDPPRAGLDPHTTEIARRFERVIYISCNPETMHRDIVALQSSHKISAFALFDQFPFTDHIECGAVLEKSIA